MSRGLTFGAVAENYERTRPGYPDRLVGDVLRLLPGPRIVELGAGTGQATTLFAAREVGLTRVELTCVEPDPDLAMVLRDRCAGAAVTVLETTFEAWQPPAESFDGLISAQARHWVDEASRLARVARLLRPEGVVALFWNVDEWGGGAVHREIDDIYASHDLGDEDRPMVTTSGMAARCGDELAGTPDLEYLGRRSYPWQQEYAARDFTDYLNTTSHHRILAEGVRSQLSVDLRQAIGRHGGRIIVDRRTDLFLARRLNRSS